MISTSSQGAETLAAEVCAMLDKPRPEQGEHLDTPDHVRSFLDALPAAAPATRDVHLKALSLPFDRARYPLSAFREAIAGVPVLDDEVSVKRRSRDYYWFSPIVREVLDGRYADLVVTPRDEAEVIRVAAAAARLRLPLTVRGAGTGTYGQAVPLYGGVVLDLSGLQAIRHIDAGQISAGAGLKLMEAEAKARALGSELRMHPSTKAIGTVAGYVCGGSGGVGSVTWGGLREPGNIIAARVVTVEETPRVLTLQGVDCNLINRTFGSTGIVTEVTLPLAPAQPWRDIVAAFEHLPDALRFSHALASEDAIPKRLISTHAWESCRYLAPVLGPAVPEGKAAVLVMAAGSDAVAALAHAHNGVVTLDADALAREADPAQTPLYECAWGHTTLHALKQDRSISYLQALFPPGRVVELAEAMWRQFGAELPLHLEFIRYEGQVAANGAQLWPFTSVERLHEIIAAHEAAGVFIANPHVFTVEDGSRHKRVPGDQLAFKAGVDPHGLLNPGKIPSYVPVSP
jgi:FAD/FMN-containing dehydrogenase